MVRITDFVFNGNKCSIRIPGALANAGLVVFRDACKHLPESVEIFEIDMGDIAEMGVSSLSMLFILMQEVSESVQVRLVNCSAPVSALLHNHGFHRLLSVNGNVPDPIRREFSD